MQAGSMLPSLRMQAVVNVSPAIFDPPLIANEVLLALTIMPLRNSQLQSLLVLGQFCHS
jgi:hypothetical protein